jgi:hypothetical protein
LAKKVKTVDRETRFASFAMRALTLLRRQEVLSARLDALESDNYGSAAVATSLEPVAGDEEYVLEEGSASSWLLRFPEYAQTRRS